MLAPAPMVPLIIALILASLGWAADATGAEGPRHGIAAHGMPKYGPDFAHFDYANPEAPKGGELSQGCTGSFDTLNPFIVLGRTAPGVRAYHFASLMARSWDEPFSLYGYVAESIETPPDRSWVTFRLDPRARFHDGSPITVDDVIFTVEALREHGHPSFRRNYGFIESIEPVGSLGVRFRLSPEAERETPLVLGLMPLLSSAHHEDHAIDQTTLRAPLGSGPYRIAEVDPGRRIVFERVEDWWGQDLPAFRGHHNFQTLRFDCFRDASIEFEAFKAGEFVLRRETSGERWATGYGFPAVADGRVTRLELPQRRPTGMTGFALNTRRDLFRDSRVREALLHAFHFEWINQNLLHGQYRRIGSYFENSELSARGAPAGVELELLGEHRSSLPSALFERVQAPPSADRPGGFRANLRIARRLLQDAGWRVEDNVLTHGETGREFRFEILLNGPSRERIALAYADSLRRLGIEASIRPVDSAQYRERTATYDFDVIAHSWGVTLSPGAEQAFYWSSAAADTEGTRNYPGVQDPVVDALIDRLTNARTRAALVGAARALDRTLLEGHYVVPLYYSDVDRFAYWGDLDFVREVIPLYGAVVETWWAEP